MAQYLHRPCEKRLFGVVDITRRKEPKMKYIMTSAAVAALVALPVTAQAQFFGSGFDNSSVLGGLAGAGIGGALGSNLAGSGNRDEGTAIGAALGGLAGVGFGNSRSRYGNNPFAGSFNPGFTGNSLLGTGAGAAVGGVIGSNLAGSGVRQEGTAIGAVLGGLAGYGLANRGGQGGQNAGFAPAGFNGGFGTPAFGNASIIGGGLGLPPRGGVSFAPSGQFVSGPVIPVTRYTQPAVTRRIVVTQPRRIAAPRPVIRRAPAPIPTTVVSVAPRVQQRPVVRATRVVVPVPSTYADCPAGMKLLKNGSCLETTNTIVAKPVARRGTLRPLSAAGLSAPISAPVQRISVAAAPAPIIRQPYIAPAPVQYANCPSGTTKQSDGSCLEATSYSAPAPVYSAPAPVFTQQAPAASCPAGTTTQPDGTCLEPTVYSAPAPVYTPPAPVLCPSGTTKQSDGTCLSPTIRQSESSYVAPAPVYTAPAPVYTAPAPVSSASTVMAITPETFAYEQAPLTSKSQTLVTTTPSVGASSQEYCYGDGGKRYDSLGREIQAGDSGCAY